MACTKEKNAPSETINEPIKQHMKITIGNKVFTADLYDNATAEAFSKLLPLSISMTELNGNEKYYYLATTLPTNAGNPGTIQEGDIMLYGNNCLVLFYKTFKTSYDYTKIGRVRDVSGMTAALGSGNVTVIIEIEQ